MSDEAKKSQTTELPDNELGNDSPDENELGTVDETDPELLELKRKIEEEKEKAQHHMREKTCDLEARLDREIEAAEKQENSQPTDVSGPEDISKTGETEPLPEAAGPACDNAFYEQWKQYVDEAKGEEQEKALAEDPVPGLDIPPEDNKEELEGVAKLDATPFNRKTIEKTSKEVPKQIVPKEQPKYKLKLMKAPICDLLLGRYTFHKSLAPEYELKSLLAKNEPIARDKNSPSFISSALLCAQIYFNLAEYEKAEMFVQEVIKKKPKNIEALYWQGMLAFYMYNKTDSKDSARKKSLAVKAENILLLVAMMRVPERKDATDIMIFWALLVLTLELKHVCPQFKIKPKNVPEVYSTEIKKMDDYLGYISWTDIYTYSRVKSQVDDAKDLLWELIKKDPNRPEAYCKLWTIYLKEKKIDRCLDICDQLFLNGNEFDDDEYMTEIVLLNAESAMAGKHFLLAYQKLQYQYALNTTQPMLLYHYGKCISLCDNVLIRNHFLCSGISALQECLRSCHVSRHGKICYWLAKLYLAWKEPLKAVECYSKIVSSSLLPKTHPKRLEAEAYLKTMQGVSTNLKVLRDEIIECYRTYKTKGAEETKGSATKVVAMSTSFKVIEQFDQEYKNYLWILYRFYVERKLDTIEDEILSFLERSPLVFESYIDFWKIASSLKKPRLMTQISDTVNKLILTHEVPNDIWIKSNMIIAKTLLNASDPPKYSEARSILQQMSQILPPLPLPLTNQYDSLEFPVNAAFVLLNTICEESVPSEGEQVVRKVSLIQEGESEETSVRVSILECDTSEIKSRISTGADSPRATSGKGTRPQLDYVKKGKHEKKPSAFQEHMAMKKEVEKAVAKGKARKASGMIRSSKPSLVPQALLKEPSMADKDLQFGNETFSVSTDWSYLYLLGKVLIKGEMNLKTGVEIMCDCVEIMKLLGVSECRDCYKAKYWIGYALLAGGHKKEGEKVLREINPYLTKFVSKMANEAAELLRECSGVFEK